jgi:chaperonin GroES
MRRGRSDTRDGRPTLVVYRSKLTITLSGGGGQIVTTATKVVLKPLEDRIVVKPLEAEQTTASGLVIPDTAKEKPQEGEVLAVGPGRFDDAGAKRVPVDVKVGDVVLYSKYGGTEVKYSGEEYLVLSARDVAPSPPEFPADSSMPVTSVVAGQVDEAAWSG